MRGAQLAYATGLTRFVGLVAVCDFLDLWGNAFGLDQECVAGGEPPRLAGTNREHMTGGGRSVARP